MAKVNGHPQRIAGSSLPPYVRRRPEIEDESRIDAWDSWVVETTGDDQTDYRLGSQYADIAVELALIQQSPAAITLPLSSMYLKQTHGMILAGAIERGFVDRVAQLACRGAVA